MDDATKCRYCQSSFTLASPHENNTADRQVTYILDKDLIRFAKFSVAVLAVFIVVGAYFFGFKLEASVERLGTLQKEVETASADLRKSQLELQNAKASVSTLRDEVESTLAQAKRTLDEIGQQKAAAIAMVVSIRELNPSQEQKLAQAKSSEPGKAGGKGKFWSTGTNIRIGFIGGTVQQRELVQRIASEWLKHANLAFSFVKTPDADIRVSFDPNGGSWSFLGTDALGVAKKEATMNLGWTERQNILHEFGHALGLIEEHQNPIAAIKWNIPELKKELSGPPNFWPESQIQERVLKAVPRDQIGEYRPFDPKSIMTARFDPRLTNGVEIGGGSELTDSDKNLVARLYPR